MLAADGCVSG